jgi:hypothetical protein
VTSVGAFRERWEIMVAAAIGAAASTIVVGAVPMGGDAAAHLYRTVLVRGGSLVWDNLWFGGQYPLTSYSVLYYFVAGWVGNVPLAFAAIVVSATLFSILLRREWGLASRWPAWIFALIAAGQLFTGSYDYVVGFAVLLASLFSFQRGRPVFGVVLAGLTLAVSPLAFIFLCIVLVAVWLPRHRVGRTEVLVAGSLLAFVCAELMVLSGFPVRGLYYPFGLWRLLAGAGVGVLGIALGWKGRQRGGATIASLFLVWLVVSVVAYLVPSPVGHNVTRLAGLALPLMLLAAVLAQFRPRWLSVVALTAAIAASVGPYVVMIPQRTSSQGSQPSFWAPLIRYLDAHRPAGFRVEVVPTANHWETYYLPRAGLQLARGWYRQLDIADNPILYAPRLTAREYRTWLRSVGVDYVVVTDLQSAAMGADREARLVLTPGDGFREVFSFRSGKVFELLHPTPILTGPRPARLTAVSHLRINGWVAAAGRYLLRVHFTPYWHLTGLPACIGAGPGGMTSLDLKRGGRFSLASQPTLSAIGARIFDYDQPRRC